jgi:ABC-type nitrate/sulfonate/bicarbonate transport system ATPase subunit
VSSWAPAPPLIAAQQVVIDNLVKQYGSLRALGGVSFGVNSGEWVALMGPSGSGKTTLINILGGLDTLTWSLMASISRSSAMASWFVIAQKKSDLFSSNFISCRISRRLKT